MYMYIYYIFHLVFDARNPAEGKRAISIIYTYADISYEIEAKKQTEIIIRIKSYTNKYKMENIPKTLL